MKEPTRVPTVATEPDEDTPPEAGQSRDQKEEAGTEVQGSSKKETRWEVGVFARRVETQSYTPPDDDAGPVG